MSKLAHHRQVNLAPLLVARNRERAQRRSVIALIAAENLIARGLPDLHLILPGELQCRLDRFRTAAGKVHGSAAEMPAGKVEKFSRELLSNRRCELAAVDELEL